MDYYDYLLSINKLICDKSEVLTDNMKYFTTIGNAIQVALHSDSDYDLLYNSMYVAALIKLYQPFVDGNHRTALIVFGHILSKKGFHFDFKKALNDMGRGQLNIPTIYKESDCFSFPNEWNVYISRSVDREKGAFSA